MDMNSKSICKLSLIDDEYNLGSSDSDSPSILFSNLAKGKGIPLYLSSRKLKQYKPCRTMAGSIFAEPSVEIPITDPILSVDPTSPFVQNLTVSNAPRNFVAPAFSISRFSPPQTLLPMKTGHKPGGLFKKEMNLHDGQMFPPIVVSSPPTVKHKVVSRVRADALMGNVTFSGVSSLLSRSLKKKFKGTADESMQLEEGIKLMSSVKPKTHTQTMSFGRRNLPNLEMPREMEMENKDEVHDEVGNLVAPWPSNRDEEDLDKSIFDSMVQHTSFLVDGPSGSSLIPNTPVKKNAFGQSMIAGRPISMGGLSTRGWMTSLPDWGGKAFSTCAPSRPSLPIHFPELSPNNSPATSRSRFLNLEPKASPVPIDKSLSLRL